MQNLKLKNLREKYPKFVYEKYSYKISGKNLEIFFDFSTVSGNGSRTIKFRPKIIVDLPKSDFKEFENLIFHLGLIEIPSYWKATCSPIIEIRAGYLSPEQIKWWKKLFSDGMCQFFYENKIDWREPGFLKIVNTTRTVLVENTTRTVLAKLKDRYLVPFAGGRDSIVTLEGLKKSFGTAQDKISLFTVNPIEKIQKTVCVSGVKKQIIVRRIIDKKLLELNSKGFLNGHTPFTALLSFLAVFAAVLFDYKNIAFSNEKSANEGNLKYLGKTINHQWAKSSTFEKMFAAYAKKYLARDINYFSYTRKYSELEISKMLSLYPQYFPVFSSCNAGMRINPPKALRTSKAFRRAGARWCGNCPKCLFVYMTLYPFLNKEQILKIFGKDLFENRELLTTMKELLGQGKHKPFECVGTEKESRLAFELSFKKAAKTGEIPYLLKKSRGS